MEELYGNYDPLT